jgi:SAM-dependent methyltransferase
VEGAGGLTPVTFSAIAAAARVLGTLGPVRDILDERVDDVEPPAWAVSRGWVAFLRALDDDELRRCEAYGLAARLPVIAGAPPDLLALGADLTEVTRLPALRVDPRAPLPSALQAVSARKREQLPALLGAVGAMAESAARIVDVGAGSGHFTRLAASMFERDTVGIERDAGRVAAAVARGGERARFVTLDACREPLVLGAGDLAVGLHACGELGDQLVTAAARAGCDVALVSCCLQKIPGPARAPLSRAAAELTLRRDTLGLANLTAQPQGVEASIDVTIEGRLARYALLRLLRARGVEVAPGEEMRGINRRRSRAGLADIAARALALRGLPPAPPEEIARHEAESRLRYAQIRRLSLPRSMLARLVEVAVVLDRAAALEESGALVQVATLFDRAVTPRNLAVFASREAARLPLSS